REDVPNLYHEFGSKFNAVVLVRDPLPRMRSQLALYEHHQGKGWNLDYISALIDDLKLPVSHTDQDRKFFVHAANMLNAIVDESKIGTIYKSEEVTTNPEVLGRLINELTGGHVTVDAQWLENAVRRDRINRHAGEKSKVSLTDWQVEVMRQV